MRFDLSDPDGGAASKTLAIETRPLPRLPRSGRTLHVVPGSGGGDGSRRHPFQGLDAAQATARPGDILTLHRGDYGHAAVNRSGEPGRPLAWKAAGDGEVVLNSCELSASHVWLEGVTFRKADRDPALKAAAGTADVVLTRNTFTGFHNSIVLSRTSRAWYIADNTIVGDNDPAAGSLEGEGIELSHSSGHVVVHNRVSRVEAGVHYPQRNCDIYGNDIFDVSDDGLEPDYGYANLRMWGNRITNYRNNGLSFQPMYCGPWYILRNQLIGNGESFKFRVQDRFLLAHNTFVNWGYTSSRMQQILTSLSRNNLYISTGGSSPVWAAVTYREDDPRYTRPNDYRPNWMTDVDYDGFDWGDSPGSRSRRHPHTSEPAECRPDVGLAEVGQLARRAAPGRRPGGRSAAGSRPARRVLRPRHPLASPIRPSRS